jgi:hypothetical protein
MTRPSAKATAAVVRQREVAPRGSRTERMFIDGVFLLVGSLQSDSDGVIVAHSTSLPEPPLREP